MKLTALILPTLSKVAFAQVDYSPDYNPASTDDSGSNIARGQAWSTVRGQMANAIGVKQTGNAFAQLAGNINQGAKPAKSGVPPTLGPMNNEKFDSSGSGDRISDNQDISADEIIQNIDLDALAQLLIAKDQKNASPKTTKAPTTTTTAAPKTKKAAPKKETNNRQKWLNNRPPGYKKQQKPNRHNYRNSARIHDTNDAESSIREAEQKAHERKLAAYRLARKIKEHRAQQQEQQFAAEGSGNAEGVPSLGMRVQAGDSGIDFSDYHDIEDFEDFYAYAESLVDSDVIGSGSSNTIMNRIEVVGENRAPIQCWTCKRTYWDGDSTGDLYDDCRRTGELVTCPQHLEDDGSSHYSSPMSCQITEHRFFGVVSELSVGCKQTRACDNNWKQNRMSGSVYGRSCRVESSFGTSKCRQCCEGDACYDGTETTLAQSLFDTDAEWMDQTNHATYTVVGNRGQFASGGYGK